MSTDAEEDIGKKGMEGGLVIINRKESIKNDFRLLASAGKLGFYKSCEVTTIFLMDGEKRARNFYTLVVFEEREHCAEPSPFNSKHYLTDRLIPLAKECKAGIVRYRLTLKDAEKRFENLLFHGSWDDQLNTGSLTPLPKQFIPPHGSDNVPVNAVLKNNFKNGSYILEFFDLDKNLIHTTIGSEKRFEKLCAVISNLVPFDLHFVQDRVGNVVFQFPSRILEWKMHSSPSWDGAESEVVWHPMLEKPPIGAIQVVNFNDYNIIGFAQERFSSDVIYALNSGNSAAENQVIFFDQRDNLILASSSLYFVKNVDLTTMVSAQHAEPRTIHVYKNGALEKTKSVDITSSHGPQVQKVDHFEHIANRVLNTEKQALAKGLIFVQYGRGKNDRKQALNDLRLLITRHGRAGVYLWDPYLKCDDIIATLYYCPYSGVPMKAISSLGKINRKEDEKQSFDQFRRTQQNDFERRSNHLGINLEFRCQYGHNGWGFHDRFLIFPSQPGKRPRAWSLGTSVNSLGKEHHILQEVGNAKLVLDAFLELWDGLTPEKCLVWSSSHGK